MTTLTHQEDRPATAMWVGPFGCGFRVYGQPQPGWSKRIVPAGGKPGARPFLTEDNRKAGPWKRAIAVVAAELMTGRDPYHGPLEISVVFYMPRPKGHLGAKGVRRSAPAYPVVKPDATKLLRPLEDALTGICWTDDAQIVTQHVAKRYALPQEEPHVDVKVKVVV